MKALAAFAFNRKKKADSNDDKSSSAPSSPTNASTEATTLKQAKKKYSTPPVAIKYCQLFDKEGDPFYFEMISSEISWVLPEYTDFLDVVIISHPSDGSQYYEYVKTGAVSWDFPVDDLSPRARTIIDSLIGISRSELEIQIGIPFTLEESLEQYRLLDEFLLKLDQNKTDNGEKITSNRPDTPSPNQYEELESVEREETGETFVPFSSNSSIQISSPPIAFDQSSVSPLLSQQAPPSVKPQPPQQLQPPPPQPVVSQQLPPFKPSPPPVDSQTTQSTLIEQPQPPSMTPLPNQFTKPSPPPFKPSPPPISQPPPPPIKPSPPVSQPAPPISIKPPPPPLAQPKQPFSQINSNISQLQVSASSTEVAEFSSSQVNRSYFDNPSNSPYQRSPFEYINDSIATESDGANNDSQSTLLSSKISEMTIKIEDLKSQLKKKDDMYIKLRTSVVQLYKHPASGMRDDSSTDEAMIKSINAMIENLFSFNQSSKDKIKNEQNRIQEMSRRVTEESSKVSDLTSEIKRLSETNISLQNEITRLKERLIESNKSNDIKEEQLSSLRLRINQVESDNEKSIEEKLVKLKSEANERISFLESVNQELEKEIKQYQVTIESLEGGQNDSEFTDQELFQQISSEPPDFKKREEAVISLTAHTAAVNKLQQQIDAANFKISTLEGNHSSISNPGRTRATSGDSSILQMPKKVLASKTPDVRAKDLWSSSLLMPNTSELTEQMTNLQSNLVVPTEYMRRQSRLFPSQQVMQYFPLELSNIDYFQRIFYILSSGLRHAVLDFLRQRVRLLDVGMPLSIQASPAKSISSNRRPSTLTTSYSNDSLATSDVSSNKRRISTVSIGNITESQRRRSSTIDSEGNSRHKQFMKISSRQMSLEDMLTVILALKIEPDSRQGALVDHSKALGFSSVDQMALPASTLLQFNRYCMKQCSSSILDTGKIGDFTELFNLSRMLLEPIANMSHDKIKASGIKYNTSNNHNGATNYCQAATLALNELWNLENQIKCHMRWKELRMLEMGWIWDEYVDHMSELKNILSSSTASKIQLSMSHSFNPSRHSPPQSQSSSPLSMMPSPSASHSQPQSFHENPHPSSASTPASGGVFWRTEYASPKASAPISSSFITQGNVPLNDVRMDDVYRANSGTNSAMKTNELQGIDPLSKTSATAQISAEKAVILYESIKAKLYTMLNPQEIAIHKIIIRLIGFLDFIRPILIAEKSSYYQQPHTADLQALYESIKNLLLSFVEKKQTRRRSTYIWNEGKTDGESERKDGLGDEVEGLGDDDGNYFYTHPKLRKLHRLLFKSAETLMKLGIIISDYSTSGTESPASSVLSADKAKDIINIHRELQNLLIPFDATSAISSYLPTSASTYSSSKSQSKAFSATSTSSTLRMSALDNQGTPSVVLTGNLVYRVTSHLDGQSIASLLLATMSKEIVGLFFRTLHGLTLPYFPESSGTPSSGIVSSGVIVATDVDTQDLDITDALSCRYHGFLCSELRASKLFHNHDILKAQYPLSDLVGMNFNVDDLRIAGYTVAQCREIGLDASEIRAGGFSDVDLIMRGGFSRSELRFAGIDISRFILQTLYEQCGGPKWRRRGSWTTERPLSEWQGVFLNGAKKIYKLDLRSNGLTGQIPEILGMLTSLEYLDLSSNNLTGQIPESLTGLRNLTDLWLCDNDLEIVPSIRPQLQARIPRCKIRL